MSFIYAFDLDGEERLHIATAGALLNESIHLPKLDYKMLLQLTGVLTQNPAEVEEMFRRMAFNVLTDNKDDHAKISALYAEKVNGHSHRPMI